MKTKTIQLSKATESLAAYIQDLDGGPIVVTDRGRAIAAVISVNNADAETISLSQNPKFHAIINRSRATQKREGGLSSQEMRQRFRISARKK
jgi:antitoxin (DNA-binding transcriptional repressor) of toxin-antitoxin stability system